MELETVNKLFLELSQFTTATTAKELELQRELERLRAAQPAVPDAMTMPTGSHDALVQSFVNGWNACRNQMLAASQRKEGA